MQLLMELNEGYAEQETHVAPNINIIPTPIRFFNGICSRAMGKAGSTSKMMSKPKLALYSATVMLFQ